MYTIEKTGQQVKSFNQAIEIADSLGSEVLLGDAVKWVPAKPVTSKAKRQYNERLQAYEAYTKMMNK